MEIQRLRLGPLTAVVTAVRTAEPYGPGLSGAALELITNENWKASTYLAPTMGMIASRFTCPHEHCRPHGISLQNRSAQVRFLPRLPRES